MLIMDPAKYLQSHPLTVLLKKKHRKEFDKISSVRIVPQAGFPPESWPMVSAADVHLNASRDLVRAYALLKWIAFDNPPDSRDLDDAYRIINDALTNYYADMGLKHSLEGKKGRKNQEDKANDSRLIILSVFDRLEKERPRSSKNDLVSRTASETGKGQSTVWRALRWREENSKQSTVTGTD